MKKKSFLIFIALISIIVIVIIFLTINKKSIRDNKLEIQKEKIIDIKFHYNEYVLTNNRTALLKKENDEFIKYGEINKDVPILLDDMMIDNSTKYFRLKDLDLYIYYKDVNPIDNYNIDNRYRNYIYFNQNVITHEKTSFYDNEDNYLYTINESFDFKILVIDENRYGVIYNNQLLYIHSDNIDKVYNNSNTDLKNKSRIKTLTYHFIYNPETYWCNQDICQTLEQFESHLKYIRENEYFTLKLEELEMYLDGKIQIPEKSIVLTIDDATIFDVDAIKLLEKYNVNATIFVITGLKDDFSYLNSYYLDLESHTNNMHNQYECPGYGMQGGGILCLPEEKVLEDLRLSQKKVGGSKYFAYPFFDVNDRAIELLKQAGFHMAFVGQYTTDGYSYPNHTNKFKVPRKTMFSSTSMDEFISYLS